jgi:ankyrin repeat protein
MMATERDQLLSTLGQATQNMTIQEHPNTPAFVSYPKRLVFQPNDPVVNPHEIRIPEKYRCSITSMIMIDPVMTLDGHTYEREAISNWLEKNNTSPKTGLVLPDTRLTPNHDKRSDIAEFLQEHPALYDADILLKEEEIYLPQSWKQDLSAAIRENRWQTVEELINRDRRLLRVVLEGKYRAIHLAGLYSLEISERLLGRLGRNLRFISELEQGVEERMDCSQFSDYRSLHFDTLLEQAVSRQAFSLGEILLALGADIEQPCNTSGNSLLHRSVLEGNLEGVRWLLSQGAELESRNIMGETSLLLATQLRTGQEVALVNFLLASQANPSVYNREGKSPVFFAVLDTHVALMDLLLPPHIAHLPLVHIAVAIQDLVLLEALFARNADVEALDLMHRTPLAAALQLDALSCIELLLKHCAHYTAVDEAGNTILHHAVQQDKVKMLPCLLNGPAVELLDYSNRAGDTPLHLAAALKREACIQCLLDFGADWQVTNQEGLTPVRTARAQGYEALAVFIEKTARRLERNRKAEQMRQWADLNCRVEALYLELQEVHQQHAWEAEAKLATGVFIEQEHQRQLEALRTEITEIKSTAAGLVPPMASSLPVIFSAPRLIAEEKSDDLPNPRDAQTFLKHIVSGQSGEAEAMLKQNVGLALVAGTVTDLSQRKFKRITGFQYAVWALDWQMWKMLLKYLPKEAAQEQVRGCETGPWIAMHDVHAGGLIQGLINALQKSIDVCDLWSFEQCAQRWVQHVGGAQLLLPVHVLQEYCQSNRPFAPCPNFSTDYELERELPAWLDNALETQSDPGKTWGMYRGGDRTAGAVICLRVRSPLCQDQSALVELLRTRIQQRKTLFAELVDAPKPRVSEKERGQHRQRSRRVGGPNA